MIAPAIDGLRREWREAASNLGASQLQFWRYVGIPVLMPSILGAVILLFGNAFAAYATAWVSALNGYSPWLGLLFGVALTCCVAAILGVVTLRLQGHFLSLSTVAWGLAIGFLFGGHETTTHLIGNLLDAADDVRRL